MLDPEFIRHNAELVATAFSHRNVPPAYLANFLSLDEKWREMTQSLNDARQKLNVLSKERNIDAAKEVKIGIKKLEETYTSVSEERKHALLKLPNIPRSDVPIGKDESDNVVIKTVGKRQETLTTDYLTLSDSLDLVDIPRAAKVTGTRFGYLKHEAARLEFALVQFAINEAVKAHFIPLVPPALVRPEMMINMGKGQFIEDKDAFYIPEDDLYLAGSAEHVVGPMHSGEVFNEKDLPRRYIAFSSSFRREAGSYGKDTKGILRVKQFDKVELFSYAKPEDSDKEHQFLLSFQESLMNKLKFPYQVMQICTGDMTFGDIKQFDINTWLPGEGKYRETHSCSNTGDFQSRGLNIKYTNDQGEKSFVHMLNATGFAIGRTLIALIENNQTKEGEVIIPKALVKYAGFKKIRKHA